jgi:glycosyltransferase involved in cell wall biosynthesis
MMFPRHFALVSLNQFNPSLYDGACHCMLARLRFIQSLGNRVSIINYLSANLTTSLFSDTMSDCPDSIIREGAICRAVFHGITYYEHILPFDSKVAVNDPALKIILEDLGKHNVDYALTVDEGYLPLLVSSLLGISCAHFFNSLENVLRLARQPFYNNFLLKHRPIISNSLFLQEQVKSFLGQPSKIWHPFVEYDDYRVREEKNRTCTIGFSASGGEIKGTALVRAISDRMPEYSFIIVGRGFNQKTGILPKNISYWGHIQDMRLFYKHIDILLVPSLVEEAFGRVILEAAINGIPTIANRVGGISEALGGSGVLIDIDPQLDIDAIAEKYCIEIRRLLDDPTTFEKYRVKALTRAEIYMQTQRQESEEIYKSYFI